MPFHRRRSYKPTFRKRTRYPKRLPSRAKYHRTVRRIARRAVISQAEPKRLEIRTGVTHDLVAGTWVDANTALGLKAFNASATGDGGSNRDGMQIFSRGCSVRMALESASDRHSAVRVLILEKLADYTAADLPLDFISAVPRNKQNSLYRVKYDRIINFSPMMGKSGTPSVDSLLRKVYPKIWVKQNKKIRYNGASTDDIDKGELRMWMLPDYTGTGTDLITIRGLTQVHYFKDV